MAIVDTGAYKTVLDVEMAKALGLKVRMAMGGDCGKFGVPGSGIIHDYAGTIDEPFELKLSERVRYMVKGQRVITHPFPMMLLGSDVLRKGRKAPGWSYVGADVEGTAEMPHGWLRFKYNTEEERVPLHFSPSEGGDVGHLAMIGGPPAA